MGHFLAQLYLRPLDETLEAKFSGRYFRYVDDIIVVCAPEEEASVRASIEVAISDLGLSINANKNDFVIGRDWIAHAAKLRTPTDVDPYDKARRAIRRWTDRIDDSGQLERPLREAGIGLPIVPVRARERNVLEKTWRQLAKVRLSYALPTLIEDIRGIRVDLSKRMTHLSKIESPTAGAARKWHVQNVRFGANRLLQLVREDGLRTLAGEIPDLDELRPLRATVDALASGDATGILPYAGPTVTNVARLWTATQSQPMKLDLSKARDKHSRQSVFTLWLFGAVAPDRTWLNALSGDHRFALFCADVRADRRTSNKFTYLDEIEALHMTSSESCAAKFRFRHSDHEDTPDDMSDLFS